nr:MAG TPA: hypothetical protein [Caudoviricetes sp.]
MRRIRNEKGRKKEPPGCCEQPSDCVSCVSRERDT